MCLSIPCSRTIARGQTSASARTPTSSRGWHGSSRRAICGSAARTAACRPTKSRALARGGFRAPEHRQRRRAFGPELPLGAAVRRRDAEGRTHHGGRPLRLRRGAGGGRMPLRPDWPTTGCVTSKTSRTNTSRGSAGTTTRRVAGVWSSSMSWSRSRTSAARRSCGARGIAASASRCTGWSTTSPTDCCGASA